MSGRARRLPNLRRLGYRGEFLLFLAFIDLLFGWLLANPTHEQQVSSAYVWRDGIMPPVAWGMIWAGVGVVLLISAFRRQDRIGYGLAISLKIGWACMAAIGGLTGHVEGAWSAVVVWTAVAGLTIRESGRPESVPPRETTEVVDERREE